MVPFCNEALYFFSIVIGNNSDFMPISVNQGLLRAQAQSVTYSLSAETGEIPNFVFDPIFTVNRACI